MIAFLHLSLSLCYCYCILWKQMHLIAITTGGHDVQKSLSPVSASLFHYIDSQSTLSISLRHASFESGQCCWWMSVQKLQWKPKFPHWFEVNPFLNYLNYGLWSSFGCWWLVPQTGLTAHSKCKNMDLTLKTIFICRPCVQWDAVSLTLFHSFCCCFGWVRTARKIFHCNGTLFSLYIN